MTEYIPTLDEVRDKYADARVGIGEWTRFDESVKQAVESAYAEFDRMIAEVERAAAAKARGEALIEAVQAHRNLHRAYASTSVCRGGIGGQAITSHCGEVCDNYEAHEKDTEAWTELEVEAIDYSSARAEAYRQERGER